MLCGMQSFEVERIIQALDDATSSLGILCCRYCALGNCMCYRYVKLERNFFFFATFSFPFLFSFSSGNWG